MATILNRRRSPTDRLTTAVPALLVSMVGDELLVRGMDRARHWLRSSWSRGVREARHQAKPIRKTARREWQKSRKLEAVIPFFPAIPVIPAAVMVGLATFSTIVAVRASRRNGEIEARLDAIETELGLLREQRERRASTTGESQPAQLPWS
jgi:hypothetical protein